MTLVRSIALLGFVSCSLACGQELLQWDVTPGVRYELEWRLTRANSNAVRAYDWNATSGLSLNEENLSAGQASVELKLALSAPAVPAATPLLEGRIERLVFQLRRNGLQLSFEKAGSGAATHAISRVAGFAYAAGGREQADRSSLEGFRDGLLVDVRDGLKLIFAPDERPVLKGQAELWSWCMPQPAVPAPLAARQAWVVPANETPLPLVQQLNGPTRQRLPMSYEVSSFSAGKAKLGYAWKHAVDERTGARPVERLLQAQERASAKLVFDRRARHLVRAEWSARAKHQAIEVVNGNRLGDGDEYEASLESTVEVRRAAP